MPKSAPLIDDLLTLGGSLFGNLVEARHEFKAQAKTHMEDLARRLDLVSREEFDAAFAMLSKARAMQEDMQERLARIERQLGIGSSSGKKKTLAKKPLPSVKQGKNRAKRT